MNLFNYVSTTSIVKPYIFLSSRFTCQLAITEVQTNQMTYHSVHSGTGTPSVTPAYSTTPSNTPYVSHRNTPNLHRKSIGKSSIHLLFHFGMHHIVTCQRDGVSNKPPVLQAATRHGARDHVVRSQVDLTPR